MKGDKRCSCFSQCLTTRSWHASLKVHRLVCSTRADVDPTRVDVDSTRVDVDAPHYVDAPRSDVNGTREDVDARM